MKKNYLFLYCCIFLISVVNAQFDFNQNIIIDETFGQPNPRKVFAADIDGDGFKDVISLGNDILWYKNNDGLGNYGNAISAVDFIFNGSWIDMDIADIDGDNDIDMVFFNGVDNTPLVWIENLDGLGNYGSPQIIKAIASTSSNLNLKIQIADMDGDGDNDIAYSDIDGIAWYENTDGQGNFVNHEFLSITQMPGDDPRDFFVADLDGDNRKDLITDINNSIDYYKHNTDGSVTLIQAIDANALGRLVIAGDVDGDDDIDIVSVYLDINNSRIEWFENTNGLGVFATKEPLIELINVEFTSLYDVNNISLVDIDNDDELDVLFNNSLDKKLSWYKNLGLGNFADEQIIVESVNNSDKYFYVADVDNDNKVDVVTSSSNESQVSWHKNLDGLGDFGGKNAISSFINGINNFAKADLDHDGDLDLITASEYDGKIAWYRNVDGLGSFTDKQIMIENSLNIVREVYSKDIDLDGDMDIIAFGHTNIFYEPSRITAYLNDGNANFNEQIILDENGRLDHIVVEDIDGDYDADIIGVIDNNNLYRKTNRGDGTFEDVEILVSNMASNPSNLKIEDIDGDGDNDVLLIHVNGDFSWYENSDGSGTFVLSQEISVQADNPYFLYVEDINDDGFRDVMFKNNSSNEIAYMLNTDGLGAFGPKVIAVSNSSSLGPFYAIDMDNDRDLDIVSSIWINSSNNQIVWFENFGDLNFGPAIEIANGVGYLKHIDAVDIDDNDSLDLITASGEHQLMWLKNLGLPRNEIQGIVTLDYDGNGCTETDSPYANAMIVADNGTNLYATFSGFNGLYQMLIHEPGDYTTSFSTNLPEYFIASPESYASNLNDLGVTEILNFCVEQLGDIHDLEISIFPNINDPRPGFQSFYRLVYTNKGVVTESGTVTLEYEGSMMNFVGSSENTQNIGTDEVVFNFQNLEPLESRFIDITFLILTPPLVNADDLIDFFATVDGGNEQDATPFNNSHGIKQTVVNSYDPNDIRVMEGEEIFIEDIDKYLHYIIRFQNTGTASAININIEHELDEKLDWQTIQLESLSHPNRVEIINGSMVNFIFNDIHLADSTSNEPASHGHIAYKIKPKADVEVGDIFTAVADIYFDFNPPIITNIVTTEIVPPLSINEFEAQSIKLFPIPAKEKLQITSHQIIDKLMVMDINGRKLNSIDISSMDYSLDVSGLSKGVYFLVIQSDDSTSTKKFIKI